MNRHWEIVRTFVSFPQGYRLLNVGPKMTLILHLRDGATDRLLKTWRRSLFTLKSYSGSHVTGMWKAPYHEVDLTMNP